MARAPSWYDHVDDAVKALLDSSAPSLERSDVERMFHLSRRDAIRLLHHFGARQRRDRLVIDRPALMAKLRDVQSSAEFLAERRRRAQLQAHRLEMQRHTVARSILLPSPAEAAAHPARLLPESVRLYRNRLEVDFPEGSHEELLARLLDVARAARDDPDAFRLAVEEAPQRS
jgi:hypothetical protein